MIRIAVRTVFSALALLALLLPAGVMAQAPVKPTRKNTTVVVIDRVKVVQESKLYRQIQDEYDAWEKGFKAQYQPKLDLLREKQRALGVGPENESENPDDKPKMPDADRKKLEKDIQQLTDDVNKLQVEGRKQYEERQKAGSQRIQAMLKQVIDKLAAEYGWDVVLNKDDLNVVWFADAVDHTATVQANLDSVAPAKETKTGAPDKPATKP